MKNSTRKRKCRAINFYRKLICILALVTFLLPLYSQEANFSMFNNAPLILNPANTGNFNGSWRITGNYRNQWSSLSTPFSSFSAGFDKSFMLFNQDLAGGVYALYDETGALGISFTKIYVSVNYTLHLHANRVRLGLQFGVANGGPGTGQTSPDQWNPVTGQFDPSLPSGELSPAKTTYPDINFGGIWKRSFGKFTPEVGFAMSHLNRPNYSFYGGNDKLGMRQTFYINVRTDLNDQIYFVPSFYYSAITNASETIVGSLAGYNLLGNQSPVKNIFAGVFLRNGLTANIDALALQAGTTVGRIQMAVNYDINISALHARGAFEISFIYKGIYTVLNSYSIPCDRL